MGGPRKQTKIQRESHQADSDLRRSTTQEEALELQGAFRETEERLRLTLEAAQFGTFEYDVQTGNVVLDSRTKQIWGISEDENLDYPGAIARIHPEDRERVTRTFAEAMSPDGNGNYESEYRILWPDGSVRWTSARGRAIVSGECDNRHALRIIGIQQDITKRKEAEEALATEKQRLDAHIDNSPLAVIEFDPDFRVIRWSREAERLFGWSTAEVIGRAIADLRWVHEDDIDEVRQTSTEMLNGKSRRNLHVNRNYRKNGTVVLCEWYNSAIFDASGRLSSVFSQVLDITARQQSEQDLRSSESRFRRVAQAGRIGIFEWNASKETAYWSPEHYELFGYETGSPITWDRWLQAVHPDDRNRVAENAARLLERARSEGEVVGHEDEYRYIHANGSVVWLQSNASVDIVRDEAIIRGTVRDVTERKQAEQKLQQSEAERSFMLQLNDALTQIDDPIQVKAVAARLLGERMQTDRVFFGEILLEDGIETLVIERDYHRPEVSSLTGRFPFREFSHTDYEDYRAGRTVCSPNVFTDEREPSQREAYRAVNVAAFIGVPLVKQGKLVSVLGVLQRRPRHWTGEEIRLAEQTVDRTWHAVERARIEAEQRRTATVVQQERDRLAALVNSITDEIWFADAEKRLTLVNPAVSRQFDSGLGDTEDVEKIAAAFEVYRGDGTPRPVEEAPPLRALRGEIVTNEEEIVRTPATGELRHRQVNAAPVRGPDGAIIGSVAVVRDITERKRAEEALEKMRFMLSEGQRIAHVGSFEYIMESRTTLWSDEECRIYGLPPDAPSPPYEVMLERFIHPDDAALLHETFTSAMQSNGIYELEHRIVRPDGTVRVVFDRANPHFDENGKLVRYVGATLDITDRKHIEEALRASEERLRAIISTLPVGVAVMDTAGHTVLANETMDRIWGGSKPAPEFTSDIPDTGRFKGWWADTGVPLTGEDWASSRALTKGEMSVGEVIDIQRFDGSRGTILNNAMPLHDANGRVNGAVVAVMDITELTQAQKALKVADRRKDEFLAMLAHELRNPLAAIACANQLLQQIGSSDPMVRRARDAATRQTAHMARLLDDLLDVARVTQGKVTLNKTDVSLLSVLESAVEASNPAVNSRKHRLYVSHPREPMRLQGDPVRLAQAISNLVDNAAKYTSPGGEVYLTVDRDGSQALISVRDNGKGIEPELLPHIFELFVQGSRSPDRAEGGLGIGLTLVRSIIELHSGSIEARSEGPGRGSEFRIRLPLLSDEKEHATEKKPGTIKERRPLRILVVDDNADSAELLAALLQIQGHEVMTANSGPAAIDLALAQLPEMALMDIGMPGMDGFEVARRFRSSQQLKHTALVAVSGYGQQEDIEKSREAGFDDHLVKPVDLEALGRVLKKISER